MAKFPAITLTKAGQSMLIKSGTGRDDDRLIFTKAVLGSGELGSKSIRDLTTVIEPKITVTVSEYLTDPRKPGQAVIVFKYDNSSVEQGFRHKEVGLYAKNGESGSETLFGYSNAGANDGYIDDKTTQMPLQTLRIGVNVGDTPNATATIDMSNAITIEQLQKHNTDKAAHQNLIGNINSTINDHRTKYELDHPEKSVKTKHLADESVTHEKLGRDCVNTSNLNAGCVNEYVIKDNSIKTRHISERQVTPEKLDRMYLQIVQESGGYRLSGFSGLLNINSSATLNGAKLLNIATADGSDMKQAINYQALANALADYISKSTRNDQTIKGKLIVEGQLHSNFGISTSEKIWVATDKIIPNSTTVVNSQWVQQLLDSFKSGMLIKNAIDVINALGSETLASLGVKYSLGENGYICFGKLFGGLILQWGYTGEIPHDGEKTVSFPISFPRVCLGVTISRYGWASVDGGNPAIVIQFNNNNFKVHHVEWECGYFYFVIGY